ncbi:MAG: PilW family protein, partial [candidate division Zixibacteria bacterium]|nr:PilW family protein [candidate division Zixibacteria bacterium]
MIELLISMVIGLTLSAGIIEVYVGSNQSDRIQQARSAMQENGHFALNFLITNIRMAGYLGCLSSIDESSINNTLNNPPASFNPELGIQGWEASQGNGTAPGIAHNSVNNLAVADTDDGGWVSRKSSGSANGLDSMNVIPGTDIVKLWSVSGRRGTISRIFKSGTNTVIESNLDSLSDGDILLLSDCDQADWVQACAMHGIGGGRSNAILSVQCNPGNLVALPLHTSVGGEIVKLNSTMFYIGKRGNVATNPPALFRRQLTSTAGMGAGEELAEGIENMQIVYGINSDKDNRNTVDAYLTANQIADWHGVISARVTLLVQSIQDHLL